MNGHVFQLQAERKQKGQFQESLEQLHVYASSTYKEDMRNFKVFFTKLEYPTILQPEAPKKSNILEDALFREEIKQYNKAKKNLESTLTSLYNVVWGQCSKLLQNKLRANSKFDDMDNYSNVAVLLTEIKALGNKTDENTSEYDALHEAKSKLFRYQQSYDETSQIIYEISRIFAMALNTAMEIYSLIEI